MRLRFLRFGVVVAVVLASSVVGVSGDGAGAADVLVRHAVVTGLPDVPPGSVFSGVGPFGLAFDGRHRLVFTDAADLGFYSVSTKTPPAVPSPLTTGNVQTGLTWSRSGELFAARFQAGDVVQVDPRTGALIRDLNPPGVTYPCMPGIATDPRTGDLSSTPECPGPRA